METPEKLDSPAKAKAAHGSGKQEPPPILTEKDIEQLNEIGTSLIAVQDLDELLKLIAKKTRQILSADISCLYLTVDSSKQFNKPTLLKFKLSNFDLTPLNIFESYVDLNTKNLLGYVGATKTAVRIENIENHDFPFEFQNQPDSKIEYPFRSVIAVPLISNKNRVIGVLKLWNKKKERKFEINSENIDDSVVPFTATDESLLKSIAGQASVAIENAKLYSEISALFDGFIRASVSRH